jgi:16S rRNA (adenine1518-N6/adenine1519-N6)-dimethyltransferase
VAEQLPTLRVIQGDVLETDLEEAVKGWQEHPLDAAHQVRVVGNLPYNISSPILFKLLKLAATTGGLTDATLMLQREVADRLTAKPGTKEYGVLSILTGLHAEVTRLLALPPGAFRPPPQVSSAVVRLKFRPPPVTLVDEALFTRMVRTMFTQRRKTLSNALKPFGTAIGVDPVAALAEADVAGQRRPETLQLIELARLADVFASAAPSRVL